MLIDFELKFSWKHCLAQLKILGYFQCHSWHFRGEWIKIVDVTQFSCETCRSTTLTGAHNIKIPLIRIKILKLLTQHCQPLIFIVVKTKFSVFGNLLQNVYWNNSRLKSWKRTILFSKFLHEDSTSKTNEIYHDVANGKCYKIETKRNVGDTF